MRNDFMRTFARKAMWITLALSTGACQKMVPDLAYMYQAQSNQVVSNFATKVSAGYQITQSSNRGMYSANPVDAAANAFNVGLNQVGTMSSMSIESPTALSNNNFNYYGNSPYGGSLLQMAMQNEVNDCATYVQNLPAIPQNFIYMVASLSRCLDRILAYRNPLLTFAYRNMSPQAQQQWAYLINWRQPGTLGNFGGPAMGVMNQYASQGYVNQNY